MSWKEPKPGEIIKGAKEILHELLPWVKIKDPLTKKIYYWKVDTTTTATNNNNNNNTNSKEEEDKKEIKIIVQWTKPKPPKKKATVTITDDTRQPVVPLKPKLHEAKPVNKEQVVNTNDRSISNEISAPNSIPTVNSSTTTANHKLSAALPKSKKYRLVVHNVFVHMI